MINEIARLNKALNKAVITLKDHSSCVDYIDEGSDHAKANCHDSNDCRDCLLAWLLSDD